MSRTELCLRGLAALSLLVALPAGAQSFRVQCPSSTSTHPATSFDTSGKPVYAEPAYTGPTTMTCTVNGGCAHSGVANSAENYVLTAGAAAANPNSGYLVPATGVNGSIKCQQVAGGDGYATMADGHQIYMFSFAPASGLANIINGAPGTTYPTEFNSMFGLNQTFPYAPNGAVLKPGDPAATMDAGNAFTFNGAVGLAPSVSQLFTIYDISEGVYPACTPPILQAGQTLPTPPNPPIAITPTTVTVVLDAPVPFQVGDKVVISGTGTAYDGVQSVTAVGLYNWCYTQSSVNQTAYPNGSGYAFTFTAGSSGLAQITSSATAVAASVPGNDNGHIDARQLMDVSVMNGNQPAPLMAIDEDDEFFLTLSNVGMIMRPDLFEQHTIHFHGYPNASAFYDGVPDASVAISIAASFSYYYLAPDAGTYFFHCHITPPEHLQMGMVGQLYVRPRQDRVQQGSSLYTGLQSQQADLRTACNPAADIACSNSTPAPNTVARAATGSLCSNPSLTTSGLTPNYVYNDGDGSSCYDVEYPIQMMGFDPNFHFVGMTFNGEGFADMKDKYFLLNGRGYPDTVGGYTCAASDPFAGCTVNGAAVPAGTIVPGPMQTPSSDGVNHFSQPLPSVINIPVGGKALLRISQLSVAEYMTLQSLGIPMTVVGWNAKLLRDQSGVNQAYLTNSITIGGGESLDVILDASDTTKYQSGQKFFLYSANLDELSNDAENFGGLMTEVHICKSVTGGSTFGNTCNL
jgi:FtsP/CotA-like multicopper oxidase with cupredoxin domain